LVLGAIFGTLSFLHKAWDYDQAINDLTGALALAQCYRQEKYELIDLYDQIIEIINLRQAQINECDEQIVELQEDLLQADLQVDAYQEQMTLNHIEQLFIQHQVPQAPVPVIPPVAPIPPVPPVVPIPPVAPATTSGVKYATPDKYDGKNKEKAEDFATACDMYLDAKGQGLTARQKINFITGYLEGTARDWVQPHLSQECLTPGSVAWLNDLALFWREFDKRFGDNNKAERYCLKFQACKQTKSVQEYLRDLQTYAMPLGYLDEVIRDHFYDGLKKDIKDMMMNQLFNRATATFERTKDLALEIDNYLEFYRTPSTSNTAKVTTAPASNTPRPRFNVSDPIFMMDSVWAKKGVIQSIAHEGSGPAQPTIKWNQGGVSKTPFNQIKLDARPATTAFTPSKPSASAPKIDNKGPAPMDLDGKGKGVFTCYNCGGHGHISTQCPSKAISGHVAEVVGDQGPELVEVEITSDVESGKGGAGTL
ncbi:hypothetical protein FRC11_006542, partial [Ceratobasidium sp. 423]